MRPPGQDGVGCQNRRPFIFQCVFYTFGRHHIEPCADTMVSWYMMISMIAVYNLKAVSVYLTNANSGSSLGSMPNSNPAMPPGTAPVPSSPTTMGELSSASDSIGPGGTVTKWELRHKDIDGLMKDCSNSITHALELLQSCTKPSNYLPHNLSGNESWIFWEGQVNGMFTDALTPKVTKCISLTLKRLGHFFSKRNFIF